MEKITTIAEGLIRLGYPVIFVTSPDFKDYIESIGATYAAIEGKGPGIMDGELMVKFASLQGVEAQIFGFKEIFLNEIPAQHRTLQRVFSQIRETHGENQPLIYIGDCTFAGIAPVMSGAPGIRPDAAMAIGVAPYPAASNDTFPFMSGLQPDTSADSKRIHFEAQQAQYTKYPDSEWNEYTREILRQVGAKESYSSMFDMFASASDTYLQYGVPEFEYPRSDLRPNLKFVGAPLAVGIAERVLPEWWNDVLQAKKAGKHIVAVTSSSVVFENNALIIPALEALKDRDDVLVIATLVTSDVEQMDYKIPDNARVSKFIPLDLVLPEVRGILWSPEASANISQVSVLITNGGYGTIQQALRAGTPLIVSGVGEDKLHTGSILSYIGNGIYNPVHYTNPEMIRDSFDEILKNQSYRYGISNHAPAFHSQCSFQILTRSRTRAEAIAQEFKKYNVVEIADAEIQKVLKQKSIVGSWLAGWI
jgi:UDP:flavonoid glycosyltransferase YjiC (YdhE family)